MKKEIAKKWVKALRSGKYNQGQGCLKQTTSNNKTFHCCLGVLCELYNDDMRKKKKKTLKESKSNGIHKFNRMDERLPAIVQKWAGLQSNNGAFKNIETNYWDNYFGLADMNDFGGSFKKIATTIEKQIDNI